MRNTNLRKLFVLFASGLAVAGFAAAATASPLNWAGSSTTILGDFPTVTLTGGGVATVNGTSATIPAHLNSMRAAASRGNITGNFTLFITDPTADNSIKAIQFIGVEGGTGTVGPISGGAASTATLTSTRLPIRGLVRLCLITSTCGAGVLNLPLTQAATSMDPISLGATKGVGIGGLLTIAGSNGTRISIQAAPWTIKQTTVFDEITTPTNKTQKITTPIQNTGFAHGPGNALSTTAQPSGVVQLVAPSQVVTNLPNGSNAKVSSGVILLTHFIPEPGLLLLLGSGIAGLALLGRSRMRK
jgi:hypothetical protein